MEKQTLQAAKRTILGRKVAKLRKSGKVPGNIYGKHIESLAVEVDQKEFVTVFKKVGETGIVEMMVEKGSHPVLVHEVTYHPVTSQILHVDFHEVNLKEKTRAHVPLALVGDAQAVKSKEGTLLSLIHEVEVEALPMDIPEKIEVDVTKLAKVGESIKVSEIKVSANVEIKTAGETDVVKVAPLVSKEAQEMAAAEAAAAAAATAEAAPGAGTASSSAPAAPTAEKKEEAPKK